MKKITFTIFLVLISVGSAKLFAQHDLYMYNDNLSPRWSTQENINSVIGKGGQSNNGAKGAAYDSIRAGASKTILDVGGSGMISRIWITINDRSPEMLRALKIEMFWDGATKPAVAVPFGDFFGVGLGKTATFHNALFANPEGRSFVSYIPMPFRSGARIVVTNESPRKLGNLFYEVDFQSAKKWENDVMYFHAYWHRDTATVLGKDFELLPNVTGKGRYLGTNIGINTRPSYKKSWWGEGEVKIFLDGDKRFPTLVGTGTEDYIGTAWGQGTFFNDFAGSLIANDSTHEWAFYRYHIPDPVYFSSACRITMQQIGGEMKDVVREMQKRKVPLIPVSIDPGATGTFVRLYEEGKVTDLGDPKLPNGWTNFYRSEDVSSTVYFYLSAPTSTLPALQTVQLRTSNLKK